MIPDSKKKSCPSVTSETIETSSKFLVGTWNVNGQSPTGCLKDWLGADVEAPDLYVIGFQELDLSWWRYLVQESAKEDEWVRAVEESLHSKANYQLVKKVRLVGMMLLVYSKEEHMGSINNISVDSMGTGIRGISHSLGNKGGVAVRLELQDAEFCFVNSHLAAGDSEVERRNQDYDLINKGVRFHHMENTDNYRLITECDQIIWMGDLNYRINMEGNVIKSIIAEDNLTMLLNADQLNQQRALGNVFEGYQEGAIMFRPTYKYDPGTSRWDTSWKSRSPAWTDRILWRGETIIQSTYRSHESLVISDHKPVSASFQIPLEIRKEVVEDMNNNEDTKEILTSQVTGHNLLIDMNTTGVISLNQITIGACVCLLSAYISYQYVL